MIQPRKGPSRGQKKKKRTYNPDGPGKHQAGTSVVAEWLRICASTAGGAGSIPSQRTRVPRATQSGKANKNQDIMLSDTSQLQTSAV